jgi:L-asparaginase
MTMHTKSAVGEEEKKKKRVLILFCGGTISMTKNIETGALDVAHGADQFFHLEPRIVEIAEINVKFLFNIDSSNSTPENWQQIGAAIAEDYDNYDGFLITHGTNTMAYTASALSFSLQNLGKPVVLTGAQIPAEIISTDGRNNLVNALRVCTLDLSGVFVVFGSKIIMGARSKKISESDLDAFATFNDSDFGRISLGIEIKKEIHPRHPGALNLVNAFEPNVISVTCIPGISSNYLSALIDSGAKGLILRGYGSGDLPAELFPALEYAHKKEIPVVVTTQCPGGATLLGVDSVGLEAVKRGVIQAFDMSMECMSTKLMWLLGQGTPYGQIKERMHHNMLGEVDVRKAMIYLNKELL